MERCIIAGYVAIGLFMAIYYVLIKCKDDIIRFSTVVQVAVLLITIMMWPILVYKATRLQ